ncbi:hypothetical protein GCM10009678_31910 [Actinomadura kijaniata]|uniref:Uncharacterized protein n=1 Tax=Actinomadura namibiensis TaxID=182080 RepID=A0A7W3LIF7_ACTNM|nr:hypothetical protein [Actinomadura namibiensis]MBA8948668.1 hypothetical protein [Actinomadura namibiensis]
MNRRRIAVLAGAAAMAAGAAVVGLATAGQAGRERRGPDEPAGGAAVVHEVRERPEDVAEYWTEERMRDARPVDMPEGPTGDGRP